jgi:hypothetical protein
MVKALARAFRWRKMLDTGVHATTEDLAEAKGIGKTYVRGILRLTLLTPPQDRRPPGPKGSDGRLQISRSNGDSERP